MAAAVLTEEQIIALQALLVPPGAQYGASLTNKEFAQRLADVAKLFPTSGQRLPMPEYVLKSLPADPQELFKGNIPLVPAAQMVDRSSGNNSGSDSSSRGRGRGGRGEGRTGAKTARGGNNEGSSTGAGADRT
jgi:hypothetical protein